MAFDIEAAKKSGYTDEDITSFLAQKHNFDLAGAKKAGHSTADIMGALASRESLSAPTAPPKQPDWMNEPGLQDVSLTPITEPDLKQAGEDTAESLGKKGHPILGAAAGTAVQMAPDLIMTAATMGGGNAAVQGAKELPAAAEGAAPLVRKGAGMLSKLARVISGPGKAEAGEAIAAAERAGGISQTLPELKTLGQELGMKNATPRQYVQRLLEKVSDGSINDLPVQKLAEHEEQIGRLLDKEPQGFLGRMLNNDKSQLGKKGVALASKTRAAVSDAINEQVPGRASALADYGAAKTRNALYKGTAAAAGTAAVGGKARKVLKTLFSGGD